MFPDSSVGVSRNTVGVSRKPVALEEPKKKSALLRAWVWVKAEKTLPSVGVSRHTTLKMCGGVGDSRVFAGTAGKAWVIPES